MKSIRLRLPPLLLTVVAGVVAGVLTAAPGFSTPLGAHVDAASGNTTFAIFAPRASAVEVALYPAMEGPASGRHPLQRESEGVWKVAVEGDRTGTYYTFHVEGPTGPGNFFDPSRPLSDPYARANVGHDGRSIIVDDDFAWTDQGFRAAAPQDLVVYEMHVKDFSYHESAGLVGNADRRGKYLGVTVDRGDGKLLGHLVELGVNAVELLPVHEFDHTAAPRGHINHWGYMTSHFFAPESSFASGVDAGQAVRELKTLVNKLHETGIAVILDVVYNHTHEGDFQGPVVSFKGIDAPYYYRMPEHREWFWNGTGTGNEFNSESPRARQLILDSLRYFIEEYHIDGFRFDLGASLDLETMRTIRSTFPDRILVCEPWTADWSRRRWDKQDLWDGSWGLWNDGFRDTIHAFIEGQAHRDEVMTVLSGSCFWGNGRPAGTVNYVEAHDGYTLADRVKKDVAKHRLAAVALLTAQGIPMLHQGMEFMKSKRGDHNSYDQDNEINWIDWSVKDENREVFEFFRGLIAIRKRYPALRYDRCLEESDVDWLRPENPRALGFFLQDPSGDADLIVLLNSHPTEWVTFELPREGDWPVLSNGHRADPEGTLGTAAGTYEVPSQSSAILLAP